MDHVQEDDLAAIGESARRYLSENATPDHLKAQLDSTGGFDHSLWRGAAEQGWAGVSAPESLGGMGLGWRGLSVLAEALGEYTVSLPLIPGAVAVHALDSSGGTGLAERFAKPLTAGGAIACLAFTEPGDSGLPERPALRLDGDRISGCKAAAAFAAVAEVAITLASAADGSAALALVPLNQPGVRRDVIPAIDQARAAARLSFDGVEAFRLDLGMPGLADEVLALAALATAYEQVGGAGASLRMAREYALERRAFGQAIGRFQAIKHKLADIYWKTEIARGCAIDALEACDAGDPLWLGLAAAARVAATEAYDFAAQENTQTHGAIGLTWEGMPHHHVRRARVLALELGGRQYWRDRMLEQVGML